MDISDDGQKLSFDSGFHGDPMMTFQQDLETDFDKKIYLSTSKKGVKDTFFCELCSVELNSVETRDSHISGTKHKKNEHLEPRDSSRGIKRIPNPVALRKKIHVRLYTKIDRAKEPFVGLKYVDEFIPESDEEMEPRYKCTLCGNEGEANAMFNHLVGRDHRARFLGKKFERNFGETSTMELMRLAGKYAENHQTDKIRTIRSDEKYPWPAGKAPWSCEKSQGVPTVVKLIPERKRVVPTMPLKPVEDVGKVNSDNAEKYLHFMRAVVAANDQQGENRRTMRMKELMDSTLLLIEKL